MHISIIDDEKLLANKISKKLESNGYSASAFYGYQDFMKHGSPNSQLYIVDLSLRDGTGFDIIKWLRNGKGSKSPIIIISGYGDTQNITYGLNLGADDYLVKPVVPDELIARIRAILRRPQTISQHTRLRYRDIVFDAVTKEAWVGDRAIYLTHNEWLILETFLKNIGHAVSRDRIIEEVWWAHQSMDISDNTINVTISKLRKKLGVNFSPRCLYNHGYLLE